jgi:N-acetylmuramate 1-kinase
MLSRSLKVAGLSAPEIYAADAATGFALIEDLGDDLFARIVDREDETLLYRSAIDALIALRKANLPQPSDDNYTMLNYDPTALSAEADLLIDWYWPLKHGNDINQDLRTEFVALWRDQLEKLSAPHSFVLRDYHAENLIWLPDRRSIERVGVIDFQDALYGCAAYDLVSLLEDARRDVDPNFAKDMIDYYALRAAEAGAFDRAAFERDYAILAAQRNAKILGVFARLAKRDKKPRYLDLLPRVEDHFRRDLKRPEIAPLQGFFSRHFSEFAQ